eukprot:SM000243S08587  [mRNA]  locus=s243:152454:155609:- [translate_table: standard]
MAYKDLEPPDDPDGPGKERGKQSLRDLLKVRREQGDARAAAQAHDAAAAKQDADAGRGPQLEQLADLQLLLLQAGGGAAVKEEKVAAMLPGPGGVGTVQLFPVNPARFPLAGAEDVAGQRAAAEAEARATAPRAPASNPAALGLPFQLSSRTLDECEASMALCPSARLRAAAVGLLQALRSDARRPAPSLQPVGLGSASPTARQTTPASQVGPMRSYGQAGKPPLIPMRGRSAAVREASGAQRPSQAGSTSAPSLRPSRGVVLEPRSQSEPPIGQERGPLWEILEPLPELAVAAALPPDTKQPFAEIIRWSQNMVAKLTPEASPRMHADPRLPSALRPMELSLPPPRLPALSEVLSAVQSEAKQAEDQMVVGPSRRSYSVMAPSVFSNKAEDEDWWHSLLQVAPGSQIVPDTEEGDPREAVEDQAPLLYVEDQAPAQGTVQAGVLQALYAGRVNSPAGCGVTMFACKKCATRRSGCTVQPSQHGRGYECGCYQTLPTGNLHGNGFTGMLPAAAMEEEQATRAERQLRAGSFVAAAAVAGQLGRARPEIQEDTSSSGSHNGGEVGAQPQLPTLPLELASLLPLDVDHTILDLPEMDPEDSQQAKLATVAGEERHAEEEETQEVGGQQTAGEVLEGRHSSIFEGELGGTAEEHEQEQAGWPPPPVAASLAAVGALPFSSEEPSAVPQLFSTQQAPLTEEEARERALKSLQDEEAVAKRRRFHGGFTGL